MTSPNPLAQALPGPLAEAIRHAPATDRNRDYILAVLREELNASQTLMGPAAPQAVLEIAAGTGQHAVAFAEALPHLRWLPSDPDPEARASISAWAAQARADGRALPNLDAPLALDAAVHPWPREAMTAGIGAMVCINMIHIAPWEACVGLMCGAGAILPPGGALVLYGPYRRGGAHTAPSNEAFDGWLKARDPRFGVRDLEAVEAEAAANGLHLHRLEPMPANNFTVVLRKGVPAPTKD